MGKKTIFVKLKLKFNNYKYKFDKFSKNKRLPHGCKTKPRLPVQVGKAKKLLRRGIPVSVFFGFKTAFMTSYSWISVSFFRFVRLIHEGVDHGSQGRSQLQVIHMPQ